MRELRVYPIHPLLLTVEFDHDGWSGDWDAPEELYALLDMEEHSVAFAALQKGCEMYVGQWIVLRTATDPFDHNGCMDPECCSPVSEWYWQAA